MDSRVHGNDDWWCGGGVLSFYVRVPLLMCLVSSYPLLFKLIPYNFGLSASFCLSVRHPRGRGDPPYSECCSSVLPLRYRYCCWFCFMLLSVVAVRFQTWHPVCVDEWIPVCTGMTAGGMAAVC